MSLLNVISHDLEIALTEYVERGFSHSQIHAALVQRGFKYSPSYVRNLVCTVKAQLRERRLQSIQDRIDQEVAVLENIRMTAFSAYERSKEPTTSEELTDEMERTADITDAEMQAQNDLRALVGLPQQTITRSRKIKSTTNPAGDPRFLEVARAASNDIRKIYGIDPATIQKVELTIKDDRIDPEELKRMDRDQLAKLLSEQVSTQPES